MSESIALLKQLLTALEDNPAALNELAKSLGASQKTVPTVDEWIPQVIDTIERGTRRGYVPYFKLLAEHHGEKLVSEIDQHHLQALLTGLSTPRYEMRRSFRGGNEARRHAVHAWRKFFKLALEAGYCSKNPATTLTLPAKKPNLRRGLTPKEIDSLWSFISSTGNDTSLDCLLIRTCLETGARRGGLVGLTMDQVHSERQTIRLLEKNTKEREQPVSKGLLLALLEHNQTRGGGVGSVFRYKNGSPLSNRRFDYIWSRVKEAPPFEGAEEISTHWLRHTAARLLERQPGSSESLVSH